VNCDAFDLFDQLIEPAVPRGDTGLQEGHIIADLLLESRSQAIVLG